MTYIDPPKKLWNHLDRLFAIRGGGVAPPVNVEIDLSNRCQLNCRWCDFKHTHNQEVMDPALAKYIVQELWSSGVRSITWTGGGEPLTNPYCLEIFKSTRIPQGLYTNGIEVEDRAEILKSLMTWVYVSLDAVDHSTYAALKGRNGFSAARDGIQALVDSPGVATIGVGFLLDEVNWKAIPTMIRLSRELKTDYIQFRPKVNFDHKRPGVQIDEAEWVNEAMRTLIGINGRVQRVEVDPSRFRMYRDWVEHGYQFCWWSGLQTVITPDGLVWGCCNKRGMKEALLGDMKSESFAQIWNRRPIQEVNDQCRILCRGHVPNLALRNIMAISGPHQEFI